MLTQRTNVLFSPLEYNSMLMLSGEYNLTMGELIRRAVRKTYKIKTQDSFEASLARIRQMTKGIKMKKTEYRALVVDGRKYDD